MFSELCHLISVAFFLFCFGAITSDSVQSLFLPLCSGSTLGRTQRTKWVYQGLNSYRQHAKSQTPSPLCYRLWIYLGCLRTRNKPRVWENPLGEGLSTVGQRTMAGLWAQGHCDWMGRREKARPNEKRDQKSVLLVIKIPALWRARAITQWGEPCTRRIRFHLDTSLGPRACQDDFRMQSWEWISKNKVVSLSFFYTFNFVCFGATPDGTWEIFLGLHSETTPGRFKSAEDQTQGRNLGWLVQGYPLGCAIASALHIQFYSVWCLSKCPWHPLRT